MHCPSTGPERSLLVRPSRSRLSPRTSYQLAAATKTQTTESGRRQNRQGYSNDIFSAINLHRISLPRAVHPNVSPLPWHVPPEPEPGSHGLTHPWSAPAEGEPR